MLMSIPLSISGDTYLYGILLLASSIIMAFTVILQRSRAYKRQDTLKWLSWVALTLWTFIVTSFLLLIMGVSLFGAGLDGLSNWAKASLALGAVAMILTIIQLVRTGRTK